jgi:hypothetical protein
MTTEKMEEGFYFVRFRQNLLPPGASEKWRPGEVVYIMDVPVVFMIGCETEEPLEDFEIGPRLTPPQEGTER